MVDYLAPKGHVMYDTENLKSIKSISNDITFFSRKDYLREESLIGIKYVYFPSILFRCTNRYLRKVLDIIKIVILRLYLVYHNYDTIVFLSYEIESIFFFRTQKRVLLVNHKNVDELTSCRKRKLTEKLPSNYKHIVLAPFIQDYMRKELPTKDILLVPHGVGRIFHACHSVDEQYIFCPANSSCDIELLKKIIEECCNQGIFRLVKIVLKSSTFITNNKNVRIINTYLTDEEYQQMMFNAQAVLMPYQSDFGYRISGIFMECIANNIPVIANNIATFTSFKKNVVYDFTIDDNNSFGKIFQQIQLLKGQSYYKNLDNLERDHFWYQVLHKR